MVGSIESVKSAWSILHLELKACTLPPVDGIDKGHKMKRHTNAHAHTHTHTQSKADIVVKGILNMPNLVLLREPITSQKFVFNWLLKTSKYCSQQK